MPVSLGADNAASSRLRRSDSDQRTSASSRATSYNDETMASTSRNERSPLLHSDTRSMSKDMTIQRLVRQSPLAKYHRSIKALPKGVVFNRHLLFTCLFYALAAIPQTWDQGSASVLPSIPSFQEQFGISASADPRIVRNYVTFPYIGAIFGAALSFFFNDILGRLWSLRCYMLVWMLGQVIAIVSPNRACLYASRIILGAGIGALSVTAPMSLAEIAPAEIRGLVTAWWPAAMGIALLSSNFCAYGVYLHMDKSRLQYQVVWLAPCVFQFLCMVASFFLCSESPRWLLLKDKHDEALQTLSKLRCLPVNHPHIQSEIRVIESHIRQETELFYSGRHSTSGILRVLKETFTVKSNLRRVQQSIILFALPQMSGANSLTSYLISILKIIDGPKHASTAHNIFISGMYALCKLCFSLLASFFFVDALGRRLSLFLGASIQMVTDIYVGVYIKVEQDSHGNVSSGASQAAIAMIFIHAFGWAIGLLVLPYVFGAELWPNKIRSFGNTLSQTFSWIFHYAMSYATPSLLANTDNWGAFIFFACWCLVSLLYVYLLVPETAQLSLEEVEDLFTGPWLQNPGKRKRQVMKGVPGEEEGSLQQTEIQDFE